MKCKICNCELCRTNKNGLCNKHWHDSIKTEYVEKWLAEVNLFSKHRPADAVRNYILAKQNELCAICGIEQDWNGQPLVFILDHINGDSTYHNVNNLRMICPNCDSQLPTFKSKNRGRGTLKERIYRNTRYREAYGKRS